MRVWARAGFFVCALKAFSCSHFSLQFNLLILARWKMVFIVRMLFAHRTFCQDFTSNESLGDVSSWCALWDACQCRNNFEHLCQPRSKRITITQTPRPIIGTFIKSTQLRRVAEKNRFWTIAFLLSINHEWAALFWVKWCSWRARPFWCSVICYNSANKLEIIIYNLFRFGYAQPHLMPVCGWHFQLCKHLDVACAHAFRAFLGLILFCIANWFATFFYLVFSSFVSLFHLFSSLINLMGISFLMCFCIHFQI